MAGAHVTEVCVPGNVVVGYRGTLYRADPPADRGLLIPSTKMQRLRCLQYFLTNSKQMQDKPMR